jgi:hypothetical protein
MSRHGKFRLALTVALTTLFLMVTYELKGTFGENQNDAKVAGVLLSVLLGPGLATTFSKAAFSLRSVRQLVLGPACIEGVWLMETYNGDSLVTCGVSQVSYNGSTDALQVHIWFPKGVKGVAPGFSTSTSVLLRESDLLYMNYFVSSAAQSDEVGVAVGRFFADDASRRSTRYEGKVLYMGPAPLIRQIGYRMTKKKVIEAKKAGGEDRWMTILLQRECPALFADTETPSDPADPGAGGP